MPDPIHDIHDRREAVMWVAHCEAGHLDAETLPAPTPPQVISFVGVLRWLGSPDELKADLGAIDRARQALHGTVRSEEACEPIEQALDQLEEWRECDLEAVEIAIQLLAKADWIFDFDSERMQRVTGKRGRPGNYLTDLVGHYWEQIRPEYRAETGDSSHNSLGLREEIAFRMETVLPPEEVDPKPKGPLDNAIRSYLKRRGLPGR
jgi:hypothetical protein